MLSYGNIFAENFDKYHCKNCYYGIRNFLSLPNLKQILQKTYVGPICSSTLKNVAAQEILIKMTRIQLPFPQPLPQTFSLENLIKIKWIRAKLWL